MTAPLMARELRPALLSAVEELRVTCDRFLVVQAPPYYVQLMFNLDCVYCEAASNEYLDGVERLVRVQEDALVDLGWDGARDPVRSRLRVAAPELPPRM